MGLSYPFSLLPPVSRCSQEGLRTHLDSNGTVKPDGYPLAAGFIHLGAGLACGMTGLSAGYAIGYVGDSVRSFHCCLYGLTHSNLLAVCSCATLRTKSFRVYGPYSYFCRSTGTLRVRLLCYCLDFRRLIPMQIDCRIDHEYEHRRDDMLIAVFRSLHTSLESITLLCSEYMQYILPKSHEIM
jgi:hypothetical protein